MPQLTAFYRSFSKLHFCFLCSDFVHLINEELVRVIDDVRCFCQECIHIGCFCFCPDVLTRPTRLPRHAVLVSTTQSKPVRPRKAKCFSRYYTTIYLFSSTFIGVCLPRITAVSAISESVLSFHSPVLL